MNSLLPTILLTSTVMGQCVLYLLIFALAGLLGWGLAVVLQRRKGRTAKQQSLVLNSIAESVLFLDPELNILYANQAARINFFNDSCNNKTDQHCYQKLFCRQQSCDHCAAEKAMSLGVPQQAETTLDDDRTIRVSARPVFGRHGVVEGVAVTIVDVTDEHHSRLKVTKENEMLEMVMDSIQYGVFDFYLSGQYVICSDTFMSLLGITAGDEQLRVAAWLELMPPEDRVNLLQLVEVCRMDDPCFELECRIKHRKGYLLWVLLRGQCVEFSTDGYPQRVIGVMADVTERKERETSILSKNHLLRTLIDNMPIGLWAKDVRDNNRYFLWNPPLHELSGHMPEDAIGKTDSELFGEKLVALHRKTDFEVLQAKAPLKPRVDEMVDIHGTKRYLQVTKAPILDADNQVSAILGIILDITDRVRVVETLRQSEGRFRSFLDVTPIGICQTTRAGDALLYANPAAAKMFGFESVEEFKLASRKKNVGKLLYAIPEVRQKLVEEFVRSGKSWDSFAVKFRRENGELFDAHLYLCLREEDLPQKQTFYSFIEDVSEQKKAESENAMLRHDLEHIARVNTLGQLAASIAHEINQPLAAIMSNAQAALRFIDQGDTNINDLREILRDIAADDRRAGDVIARLRALLKRKAIELMPVNINSVIDGVCALVESDFITKGIAMNVYKEEQLADVNGDRIQLQQVLLNLFTNGAEAMVDNTPGTKVLTVRSRQIGGSVHVSVSDCGCGVGSELMERIFDPFFTTKKHGLGMGLSINRTIINSLGGQLVVEKNENNNGVCFTVILPVDGTGSHPSTISPCS